MKKKHFAKLTNIECPFGMLTDHTKRRLSYITEVQVFDGLEWVDVVVRVFDPKRTYRQKPTNRD